MLMSDLPFGAEPRPGPGDAAAAVPPQRPGGAGAAVCGMPIWARLVFP